MPTPMSNTFAACVVALAASALCASSVLAADTAKPAKPAKTAKAKSPDKKAKTAAGAPDVLSRPVEPEPDLYGTVATEFACELGNKVTTYHSDFDTSHIALRWQNRVHRLNRVATSTGAQRFENTSFGLIWIGIPSKGMLLDSKLNRQLANECQSAAQRLADATPRPFPSSAPSAAPVSAPAATPVNAPAPAPGSAIALPVPPAAAPVIAPGPVTAPAVVIPVPAAPAIAPALVPATTPAAAPAPVVLPVAAPAPAPAEPQAVPETKPQ